MELNRTEQEVINLMRDGALVSLTMGFVNTNKEAREKLRPLAQALDADMRHVRNNSWNSSWNIDVAYPIPVSAAVWVKGEYDASEH